MSKVLIGVVTYGKQRYCLDEFCDSLSKQTVKSDILFVVNHGEDAYATLIRSKGFKVVEDPTPATTRIDKILNGRNYLRDHALKNDYDYLLFLDSDIMIPANGVEILLSPKIDVLSGAYLNAFEIDGEKVVAPVMFKDLGNGECQLYTYNAVAPPQVFEIGAAGLGCTLISKKVLEKIKFRTFSNSATGGEDMAFYVDARAKGFRTFGSSFVKCVHRPYPKDDPRAGAFEWRRNVERWNYKLNL